MRALLVFIITSLTLTVGAAPHGPRVVTLSPHATELVHFAGGGNLLVGVSAYSDFPASVKQLPIVGDANGFDRETLLQLQPDVVIGWEQNLDQNEINWLKHQGFELFMSNPASLQAIGNEVRMIGALLGTDAIAAQTAEALESIQQRLVKIGKRRKQPLQVLHLVWQQPQIVLTSASMVSRVLSLCAIETPITVDNRLSATLSREQLYHLRLDAILVDRHNSTPPFNPRNVPVLPVDSLRLHRPSPRMADAVLELCESL